MFQPSAHEIEHRIFGPETGVNFTVDRNPRKIPATGFTDIEMLL